MRRWPGAVRAAWLANPVLVDVCWLPNGAEEPFAVVLPKAGGDCAVAGADGLPNTDVVDEAPKGVELPNDDWPNVDVVPPLDPNGVALPNVD